MVAVYNYSLGSTSKSGKPPLESGMEHFFPTCENNFMFGPAILGNKSTWKRTANFLTVLHFKYYSLKISQTQTRFFYVWRRQSPGRVSATTFLNEEQTEVTGGSVEWIRVSPPPAAGHLIQCRVQCERSYTKGALSSWWLPDSSPCLCLCLPLMNTFNWAITLTTVSSGLRTGLKEESKVGTVEVLQLPGRRRREAIWLETTQKVCLCFHQYASCLNSKNKKVLMEVSSSQVLNNYLNANHVWTKKMELSWQGPQ